MFRCFNLLVLIIPFFCFAQTKEELQEKRKKLNKEINYTNELLSEINKSKSNSILELTTLGRKIEIRQEIIISIIAELDLIEKIINKKKEELLLLEEEVALLKNDFTTLIQQAYKSRNTYDKLLFILSSKDFYQAYKRIKLIQQYSKYTKNQATKIQKKQSLIELKIIELNNNKINKENLLSDKKEERSKLNNEKSKKDNFVESLYQQESKLLKTIKEKEKAAEKLESAIEKIIKEEIRKAKERASKNNKSDIYSLTPEAKQLSDDFSNNMGKLPWPVEKGIIINEFGIQPHPILPGIKTNNNGVDIATNKGSVARSSFDGEVSAVIIIPGANKAVIIRHGEYLSVYSNLSEVFVKTGDKIKIKQEIGLVYTGENTQIHFEIWKGTNKLNPSDWLFFE